MPCGWRMKFIRGTDLQKKLRDRATGVEMREMRERDRGVCLLRRADLPVTDLQHLLSPSSQRTRGVTLLALLPTSRLSELGARTVVIAGRPFPGTGRMAVAGAQMQRTRVNEREVVIALNDHGIGALGQNPTFHAA